MPDGGGERGRQRPQQVVAEASGTPVVREMHRCLTGRRPGIGPGLRQDNEPGGKVTTVARPRVRRLRGVRRADPAEAQVAVDPRHPFRPRGEEDRADPVVPGVRDERSGHRRAEPAPCSDGQRRDPDDLGDAADRQAAAGGQDATLAVLGDGDPRLPGRSIAPVGVVRRPPAASRSPTRRAGRRGPNASSWTPLTAIRRSSSSSGPSIRTTMSSATSGGSGCPAAPAAAARDLERALRRTASTRLGRDVVHPLDREGYVELAHPRRAARRRRRRRTGPSPPRRGRAYSGQPPGSPMNMVNGPTSSAVPCCRGRRRRTPPAPPCPYVPPFVSRIRARG